MKKFLYTFLFTGLSFSAFSQQYSVKLQSGSFVPEASVKTVFNNSELYNGRYYRYIQFFTIPTEQQKQKLQEQGIRLMSYLPENVFIASIASGAVLNDKNIRSVFSIDPAYKLSNLLAGKKIPDWAMRANGKTELIVSFQEDMDAAAASTLITGKGFTVLHILQDARALRILVNTDDINRVAALPFIYFVEPAAAEPIPDNLQGVTNHRSNVIATSYASGLKYDGTGVIVALNDDGVIGPHIDYKGRIISSNMTFNNGDHGDHCAGIIMGAGNRNPITRGMAYGAKMQVYGVSSQFSTYYQAFDSINAAYAQGVRITSTSYSNGDNAGYTALARTMDIQTNNMPQLIHVFSAGNSGTANFGYGAGAGWGNITGGHKQAKNVIAVGNLLYTDALATSSSRGPAKDGRIKPDICAVGTDVYSTVSTNTYQNMSGTSMACPGVAGTLAQLYHAYRSLNGGNNPPSALIKAAAMNTADDLGNPGPDYRFGYGRINAARALTVLQHNRYFVDSVAQGNAKTHTISVPANTAEIRIMVYWHDYQATAGAAKAIVNNLNMTVTTPAAATILPWVLNPTPNAAALNTNAVQAVDSLNNVEQVTIPTPAAGNYTVNVNGFSVPNGPQKYYVVYEFVSNDVTLTYPIGGESLVPIVPEHIRWDAYGATGPFTVQYSTNNGASWTTLSTAVPASQRYYTWTPPATVTGKALVKVTRGSSSDQSDTTFSIIAIPAPITVDWVCIDSMKISYGAVTGANGYVARVLGNQYMDSAGYSTTTSCVIKGINTLSGGWVSVEALGTDNARGRRANAIQFPAAPFNCIISNDLGITAHSSPSTSGVLSCAGNTIVDSVKISFINNGTNPVTNVGMNYTVNGGPVVSAVFAGPLNTAATANYTFPVPIAFNTAGIYTIKAWVVHSGDFTNANDTITWQKNIVFPPTRNLPVTEDFETFTLCDTFGSCGMTTCGLANGWSNAANTLDDDIDWRTNNGPTPSRQATGMTGPRMDFNPGTAAGKYLYLEGDNCYGKEAHLVSPCISLVGQANPELKFAYHMFGSTTGELHVDIFANGGWTNDVMPPVVANQGDKWSTKRISLPGFSGRIINVRFRGLTGASFESDIALDDISLINAPNRIPNTGNAMSLEVYPNPSKNIFNVTLAGIHANATIVVTDVNGKVIRRQLVTPQQSLVRTEVDLKSAASGVYFLSVYGEHEIVNQKLIKL